MNCGPFFVPSAKQLAGLVYVALAVFATGLAVFETNGSIQWYGALDNLDMHVSSVAFHLDGQPLGHPYLIVAATVNNPGTYGGLRLTQIGYNVFVDSSNESFIVQDSSAVAQTVIPYQGMIPAQGSLNVTNGLTPITDVVSQLQPFLDRHNQTDLIEYVGLNLYFHSVYGNLSVPFCYRLPENRLTICPAPRGPSGMGRPGGG